MGCDIHIWIEKSHGEYSFLVAETRMSRFYHCFGLLANGVRGCDGMFEPRGFPNNMSHGTATAVTQSIVSDEDASKFETIASGYCENDWRYLRHMQTAAKSKAERWLKSGSSDEYYLDGERRITDPDYHTPSWLTLEEVESIAKNESGDSKMWMTELVNKIKAAKGDRIVFCFDN